jgi:predicted nucleotide-binding protein
VFSEDDPLEGPAGEAAPRDNVVFEAGVFIGTKGATNCLIVRVGNAKMPADLGGTIYVSLAAGADVSTIDESIRQFVDASIQ